MKAWHWVTRWRDKRRAREEDLKRELSAHLDLEAESQADAGASPDEARYAARRAFGNQVRVAEEVRDVWGWTWLEQLLQDLGYAVRTLRKNAGFTAVAGLSLALGIGGNAAMFSLVDGVVLRPLEYSEPDRLVRVTDFYPQGAVVALQQRSQTMEVAGYISDEFNFTGQGEALHLNGCTVSANLFSLLGVTPALGRVFEPGEDRPGRDRLVILSYGLWKNVFASDPGILGRVITLDGVDRQVVGVMPARFTFLIPEAELWVPLRLDPSNYLDYWNRGHMPLVARLRPGATVAQARRELRSLIQVIIPMFTFPMGRDWNSDASVLPLQQDLVGDVRAKLLVLLGAVSIVLLIACVNVASLLLSLGAARRKEIALRAALGAARGRIVRQLLTESVVLALAGGGAGVALAFSAFPLLKSMLPADTPRLAEVAIDWRVLAFVTALSVLTGLAFGLAPALRASRPDLAESLKAGGRRSADASGISLRSSLIVGEVALAMVLAVSAGLLIKSLWRLVAVDPGFRPERILAVKLSPDPSFCRERAACIAFYDELLRRAGTLEGVSQAAAVNAVPLGGQVPAVPVEIEGHPRKPTESVAPLLWAGAVTPGYFRLMGVPLLEGRAFTDSDGEKSAPVIIVSAATARHYWPGEDPIGKHIRVVWDRDWRTVVGVAGDVRLWDLASTAPGWTVGVLYMPYPQSADLTMQMPASMTLLVRTSATNPSGTAGELRGLSSSVNPNIPVDEARSLDAIVTASTSHSRSMMWLFVGFAAAALILAAIGTYGVVSYSAAQRTYEIGVRMALGATRRRIFGLVLGQSVRLALVGLALGAVAALALTRMLRSFLFGVATTDPTTFLAVGALLVVVALFAGYLPARRAAAVNPLTALRVD